MTRPPCNDPIDVDALVAYWLGELPATAEAEVDEHLFECAHCTQQLEGLAALAMGIGRTIHDGLVPIVITPLVVDSMRRHGMTVREYSVAPGHSVHCTITAQDDAVIGRMQAALTDVRRLDAVQILDLGEGHERSLRIKDLPFDPNSEEVISMPAAAALRLLPEHTWRVRLLAVDGPDERALGEYTFKHTPAHQE